MRLPRDQFSSKNKMRARNGDANNKNQNKNIVRFRWSRWLSCKRLNFLAALR